MPFYREASALCAAYGFDCVAFMGPPSFSICGDPWSGWPACNDPFGGPDAA